MDTSLTLKQRIQAGHTALGSMVFEFFSPGMARIAREAGADFLIYDMEHSGTGIDTVKAQCAACAGTGLAPIVRVPHHDYSAVAGALDAGAHGIMVPMVASAAQAAELVSFTRYPPRGRRGAAFGMAHDGYRAGSPLEKMAAAEARTLVVAMIETVEGLAEVDAIAAVPGVDVLFLGHFDLTNFMGIPAAFTDPRFEQALADIGAAARRHGKIAGTMAGDAAWAARLHAHGFRLFACGIDVHLYQQALAGSIRAVRALG
jgi:2-keto-3-deoxy-L-rhamnonate aldolase RhmA